MMTVAQFSVLSTLQKLHHKSIKIIGQNEPPVIVGCILCGVLYDNDP